MQYTIVSSDDGAVISVFSPNHDRPLVVHQNHPRFDEILEGVLVDDESVLDLIDLTSAVASKFERLSERVTAAHGHVYFDGNIVDTTLTKQVGRFLDEGVDDWRPLVAFFEKVQTNPNEHSREMLFDWLEAHDFTITSNGDIVGYKGVNKRGDEYVSGFSGKAIVDGQVHNGQIPNYVGAVVEMPRGEVTFDPTEACSAGLHVGTFRYAQGYANGAMLEVHVNPRDVVSVPTDGGGEKVRVCRYRVVDVIQAPLTSALTDSYDEDEWDEDYDDGYDDYESDDLLEELEEMNRYHYGDRIY